MIKNLFFIFLLHLSFLASAQDMNRVRQFIDTLASPHLHGRGYVNKGDSLAAIFIADRFKEYGLRSFNSNNDSYFQRFDLNINTFPGKLQLCVDGKKLEAGKDYILNPASGGGSKKLKTLVIDSTYFTNEKKQNKLLKIKSEKYAFVLEPKLEEKLDKLPKTILKKIYSAGAIIELTDSKLTASLARQQLPLPWFTVLKEKYPAKTKTISLHVDSDFIQNYKSQNVIGYIPGKKNPDSFFVFSAHYDHLGRMGNEIYFPGANDNASGISMLLELANYYSKNIQDYSIAFMAFGAEEAGLVGSFYYVKNPYFPLSNIRFLVNMDLLGTGEEGITVVNATLFPEAFNELEEINKEKNLLSQIKKRGPAANSDHYPFTQKGVPAFFIYTLGGITAYHDIFDRPETLPLTKFPEVFRLLVSFLDNL